jgi:hypothetical protein
MNTWRRVELPLVSSIYVEMAEPPLYKSELLDHISDTEGDDGRSTYVPKTVCL